MTPGGPKKYMRPTLATVKCAPISPSVSFPVEAGTQRASACTHVKKDVCFGLLISELCARRCVRCPRGQSTLVDGGGRLAGRVTAGTGSSGEGRPATANAASAAGGSDSIGTCACAGTIQ